MQFYFNLFYFSEKEKQEMFLYLDSKLHNCKYLEVIVNTCMHFRLPLKIHNPAAELKVILLGEEWVGKSSAGNTILGFNAFSVAESTEQVSRRSSELAGKHITMVDTPGWDPESPPEVPHRILERACGSAAHGGVEGPHVILLTLPVCLDAEWNKRAADRLQGLFGKRMWRHTILLFTRAHLLGRKSIEQHLEGKGKALQVLVEKCEHRYHALHNINTVITAQVRDLLEKMERMVEENGGRCYNIDQTLNQAQLKQQSTQIVEMESQMCGQEETCETHEKEAEFMRLLELVKIQLADFKEKRRRKRSRRKKNKQGSAIMGVQEDLYEMSIEADKHSAVHEQPEHLLKQVEEAVESVLDEQSEIIHEEVEIKVLWHGLPSAPDHDEKGRRLEESHLININIDREIEMLPVDNTKLEIKNAGVENEPCDLIDIGKDGLVTNGQTQEKYEGFTIETTSDDWQNASEKFKSKNQNCISCMTKCTTDTTVEEKVVLIHKYDCLEEMEYGLKLLKVMTSRGCKSYIHSETGYKDLSQVMSQLMDQLKYPVDSPIPDVDSFAVNLTADPLILGCVMINLNEAIVASVSPEEKAEEKSAGEIVEDKGNDDTRGICRDVCMQTAIKEEENASSDRKHEGIQQKKCNGNRRQFHSESIDDSVRNEKDKAAKAQNSSTVCKGSPYLEVHDFPGMFYFDLQSILNSITRQLHKDTAKYYVV